MQIIAKPFKYNFQIELKILINNIQHDLHINIFKRNIFIFEFSIFRSRNYIELMTSNNNKDKI
jgi:hypothetical protein